MAAVEKLVTNHLNLWTAAIKRRSAAGRGSSSKIELYGIKKLRELILELAVRGLLVPQDPSDEPASELLKRIAAKKAELVKEGKIKKDKSSPEIAAVGTPFELPTSWAWQHLADVFYPISVSKNKVKTSEVSEKGTHPVVDQGQSFIAGYVDDDNLLNVLPGPVIVFGDHTSALKYINFNFVAGADGVKILRPMCCDERYFFLVCKTLPIESRGYGRHYSRLIDNLLPLPPLAEQSRIVAKVDELMILCDQLEQQTDASLSGHQTLVEILLNALISAADQAQFASAWQRIAEHFDSLFTTEESIDQLKRTILQLAVMGKLVPQDLKDEPASELLKKIAAEKAKLMKEGKIKKEKPLPPIAEEEKLFQAPSYWKFVRLLPLSYEIGTGPFGSMIHQSDYVDGGVPLINPSHMVNDLIVEDATVAVDQEKAEELSSYRVYSGDIVLARRGEVGRCAIVTGREDGWLCGTGSFYLRLPPDVSRRFMALVFRASSTREYLVGNAVGATMANLNHGILNNLPIAIPPIKEQHRIVAKVDELMTICNQLESRLIEVQATQLHLADALTEKALART